MIRQHAYVINLDDRQDRWLRIQENFRGIPSIELVRVSALQGQPAWKYCGYSHQQALRMPSNGGHLLVLEDDCHIPDVSDFNARWPLIKQWLDEHPADWDIFLGGASHIARPVRTLARELGIVSLGSAYTSHFLYCHRNAVDKMLAWQPYLDLKFDCVRAYAPDIRILTAAPFLALQTSGFSNVEAGPIDYTRYFDSARQQLQEYLRTGSPDHISFYYLVCHTWFCRVNGLVDNLHRIGMDIYHELYEQLPDTLKLALVNDLAALGNDPVYRSCIREFVDAWLARDRRLLMVAFLDPVSRNNVMELSAQITRLRMGADGSG